MFVKPKLWQKNLHSFFYECLSMKTDLVNLYSTSQKIIREEKNSILLIVFIFLPSWLLSGKSLFVLWLRPGRAMINWHDWQHTASCDTTACYRSFLPVWPSHITILCFFSVASLLPLVLYSLQYELDQITTFTIHKSDFCLLAVSRSKAGVLSKGLLAVQSVSKAKASV